MTNFIGISQTLKITVMNLRKLQPAMVTILFISAACSGNVGEDALTSVSPITPDSVIVPVETAKQLVANYAPHAGYVVNAQGDTSSNTRALWFSAEQLEALLDRIRTDGGDGIRFYLATYNDHYPDSGEAYIPPRDQWGHHTLLMVPTREAADTNGMIFHQDYYADYAYGQESIELRITAPIENDAAMCPPNCPGADLIEPRL